MRSMSSSVRLPAVLVLLTLACASAYAGSSRDRTQVGRTIIVGPNEEASDVTCFGCSVRVHGHVSSDVTAFAGSIILEDQASVDGDVTSFGGNIRLDEDVKVGGDVTVFGGRIQRDAGASIGGDVTDMGGPGWIVPMILAPFILVGAFVALLIWLIRRVMRPSATAAV